MIKTNLIGGENNRATSVIRHKRSTKPGHYPPGQMTYTEPFWIERNRPISAVDENGGASLNVNGLVSGGTPDSVHNGIDTVLWTGSNILGTNFVFDSTDQAQSGTQSIDASGTVNGDQALLERSAAITHTLYSALTGFIYVDSWPAAGTKDVQIKFRLAGSDVGNTLNLSSYINTGDFDTWQSFTISLSDFALSGTEVDQIVITTIDIGGGQPPDYYLDNIVLGSVAGGTPATYVLEPRPGEIILVKGFDFTFVFPYDPTATVAGATENFTTPLISYNKFCHLSELANGLNIQRIQNNNTQFSIIVRNNFDLLKATNRQIDYFVSDGTNTMLKISSEFTAPVLLDAGNNDRYEFIVNDDLSSLIEFEVKGKASTITEALE